MTVSAGAPPRDRVLRALRAIEVTGIMLGVVLIAVLHIVSPTSGISPLTVTISEYGRSPLAALFVAGVVLIATGSAATLALLVRSGACRALSVPGVGFALWVAGMIGVAVFQKADWAAGATLGGYIHRTASLVAFVALPVAILALALSRVRRRTATGAGAPVLMAVAIGVTASLLLVMVALGVYVVMAEDQGVAWWTVLPIGLIERVIVFTELVALALLLAGTRVRRRSAALVAA